MYELFREKEGTNKIHFTDLQLLFGLFVDSGQPTHRPRTPEHSVTIPNPPHGRRTQTGSYEKQKQIERVPWENNGSSFFGCVVVVTVTHASTVIMVMC